MNYLDDQLVELTILEKDNNIISQLLQELKQFNKY